MKIKLYREESGYLYEDDDIGDELELPEAIVADLRETAKHYEELQDYLSEKWEHLKPAPSSGSTKDTVQRVWSQALITDAQREQARRHCHALMAQYTGRDNERPERSRATGPQCHDPLALKRF